MDHQNSAQPARKADTTSGSGVDRILRGEDRLVMVVGNYGSGKTEVSVNLAIQLAASGREVKIADLDIVNPYFRCREARQIMEEHGIRVIVPPGALAYSELPIILPELAGMFGSTGTELNLFDVGGDDVGARSLSSFRPLIGDRPYELWQVINSRRPFTSTVDGCLEMQRGIEAASRLKVTGLLVNSHLMQETTPQIVLEGWQLAKEVSKRNGLAIRAVAAMGEVADSPELAEIDAPVLRLERYLLPPWLQEDSHETESGKMPARRPTPIGTPPTPTLGRRSDKEN